MPPVPFDRELRAFALELHALAYEMPNGHEFELLQLARRMTAAADAHLTARVRDTQDCLAPATSVQQ
jgi:hypothetical protein